MSRRVIIDELEIEVPYGKLAAKTWHEETDESKRILFLHGWMDNAGSFDNMIPYLKHKNGLYIVALDLPGHGKSSQLPPGTSYSDLHILMEIRRCLNELKWTQPVTKKSINNDGSTMVHSASSNSLTNSLNDTMGPVKKFSIIGHSLGAGLGLFYSTLFPDDVENIVLLDFIKTKTPPLEELLKITAETIDQFIDTVPSQSPFSSPVIAKSISSNSPNKTANKGQVIVSQETAIIGTIEAHKQLGVLTRDDATCLLKRSTVAVSTPPNCVIYSRDLRLQSMLNLRDNFEISKVMFANIKTNVLVILGKKGIYAENELFKDRMDEMVDYIRAKATSLQLEWVEGDHYFHMNKPQQAIEMINKFLDEPDNYKVESQ